MTNFYLLQYQIHEMAEIRRILTKESQNVSPVPKIRSNANPVPNEIQNEAQNEAQNETQNETQKEIQK